MYTIHKLQLEVTDVQTVKLPAGAKILSIQPQYNKPCMWYLFENKAFRSAILKEPEINEARTFRIFGTGNPISNADIDKLEYINTFQVDGGMFVFHVFEMKGGGNG